MRIRNVKILFLLCFALFFVGCIKNEISQEVPNCIERKIRKFKLQKVQNPPASVWEWKDGNNSYYFIPSGCCDQYNFLYDENCNIVCAPNGGFWGAGDGNCPDFGQDLEITLIWEDDRE